LSYLFLQTIGQLCTTESSEWFLIRDERGEYRLNEVILILDSVAEFSEAAFRKEACDLTAKYPVQKKTSKKDQQL
jgi:hypothetical protein